MNKNILKSITDISEENITKKVVNNLYCINVFGINDEYIISDDKKKVYDYYFRLYPEIKHFFISESFILYNHLYDDHIKNILENYIHNGPHGYNYYGVNMYTDKIIMEDFLDNVHNDVNSLNYIHNKFDQFYQTMSLVDLEKIDKHYTGRQHGFIKKMNIFPLNFI